MKAESVVVLLAVVALFLLGMVGFLITGAETDDQGLQDDDIQIASETRPFFKVGISSVFFGIIILLIFALVAGASRLKRA